MHADAARTGLSRVLILLLLLLGSGRAAGQIANPATEALGRISPDRIAAAVQYLAGDQLEGRAPGSRGERLAAEYVANQFAKAGVLPVRGSYFQTVPLLGWRIDAASSEAVAGRTTALPLTLGDDVVLWSPTARARAAVAAPVIFAGYGTRAPEYGWDDYSRDVRGRIVLVLVNEPPSPFEQPDFFEGDALTYYGRWNYKLEEAARQGAAAVLLVHTDASAGYGWDVVRRAWGEEVITLAEDSAAVLPPIAGWIRYDAARRLLESSGLSLDELYVRAARRDFVPVELRQPLRLQVAGTIRRMQGRNVVGVVNGRHPTRRHQYVGFSAHYDHLGIGRPVDGDSIYNGAYDNASGVALLLELARAFGALRRPVNRSMLFIATTAEEPGMLGATYYTRHPRLPLDHTVALINIEGVNLWGETNDIGAVGTERSTLGLLFERSVMQLGLRTAAERAPEQGYFFRSDQYPFALAGVPAISLEHGLDFRGRDAQWGQRTVGQYLSQNYHAPSDELSSTFDFSGAVQQARAAFLLGYALGMQSDAPAYYDSTLFGAQGGGRR